MLKKSWLFLLVGAFFGTGAYASDLTRDTSDPLFLQERTGLLSRTSLDYFDTGLRMGQSLSYGLHDRFAFGAKVFYQQSFDSDQDGFSSVDLGGIYRMGMADESSQRMIYDVLAGLKIGGSRRVRTPDYADSTYYAGLRFGRQYDAVTFAGTVKASWIFDDVPMGMSYIDFVPEVYFRVNNAWRIGGNAMLRKSTNSKYDEESIGIKLVREYGRTQYVGHCDYAFEADNISAGASVNILF